MAIVFNPLLQGGLRSGAVHEVFSDSAGDEAAAAGFALALAIRALIKGQWLLWVQQDFSALEAGETHAQGLCELGGDPDRVLMLRAPDAKSVLRAASEGLHCKGIGVVLIEPWGEARMFDLLASRRLTLAAQQHGATAIVLRLGARPQPSAAETRWIVKSAESPDEEDWGRPRFTAALVRNRHGPCGEWVMEWDCNNGIFCEPPAHYRAVAAEAFHRSPEAAMEGLRQAG
ncbi:MAG: DNA repair protein [Alphaproteobacteria bacterium]|nr:DNA repair protein [Alphaproteobacteria bacterium]